MLYGGRESSTRCNLRKQLPQFDNTHAANAHNTTKKRNALQIEKNSCKLRKHFRQIDNAHANAHNTCKCSQHNQKRNEIKCIWLCCEHLQRVSLFVCVVSIFTICCQNDEMFFLICWCFFYLHVFSEVAVRWALSATVDMCVCVCVCVCERARWHDHFNCFLIPEESILNN